MITNDEMQKRGGSSTLTMSNWELLPREMDNNKKGMMQRKSVSISYEVKASKPGSAEKKSEELDNLVQVKLIK